MKRRDIYKTLFGIALFPVLTKPKNTKPKRNPPIAGELIMDCDGNIFYYTGKHWKQVPKPVGIV